MATTPKKKEGFTVSLTIMGKEYKGKGDTLADALTAMPRPPKSINKGSLTITDGKRKNTIHMTPVQTKQLCSLSKNWLSVRVKSLMLGLR